MLDYCARENIGFIPWFPLATGDLAKPGGPLARVAERLGATPAQVATAALLELDDSVMEELEKVRP